MIRVRGGMFWGAGAHRYAASEVDSRHVGNLTASTTISRSRAESWPIVSRGKSFYGTLFYDLGSEIIRVEPEVIREKMLPMCAPAQFVSLRYTISSKSCFKDLGVIVSLYLHR